MLVSLVTLKSILGIEGTAEDTLLETLLQNAQGIAENIIGGKIELQTFDNEEMDGHGEQVFILPSYPVVTLTSFQYKTGDTWETVTDSYHLKKQTGEIRLPNSIVPRGYGNVRFSWTAGYTDTTVPADIKQAIIDIASSLYNLRGSTGIKREKIDGAELEFVTDWTVSAGTREVLQSYRKINV